MTLRRIILKAGSRVKYRRLKLPSNTGIPDSVPPGSIIFNALMDAVLETDGRMLN